MSTNDPYTRRPKSERERDVEDSPAEQAAATPTALGRLQAGIQASLERYERDRADALRRLDNSGLLTLAQDYAHAITPDQRDRLAAGIADRLTIDEAGVILRAAAAVRAAVPRIVLRAKSDDDTTAEIARELGMTDSYVRRIVREHRQFSWRLDLYDSEAGPGWQAWESGEDVMPHSDEHNIAAELAVRILSQAGQGPREHRARVLIWTGTDEQPDDAAIYRHEQDPTA
jgi:transposase-like protein